MIRRDFIIIVLIGIALVAVPFVFRALDHRRFDEYIRRFEVNEDEADEGQEHQGKATHGKKKASKDIPEGAIGIIEIKRLLREFNIKAMQMHLRTLSSIMIRNLR